MAKKEIAGTVAAPGMIFLGWHGRRKMTITTPGIGKQTTGRT